MRFQTMIRVVSDRGERDFDAYEATVVDGHLFIAGCQRPVAAFAPGAWTSFEQVHVGYPDAEPADADKAA